MTLEIDLTSSIASICVNDPLKEKGSWREGKSDSLIFKGVGYSVEITRDKQIFYRGTGKNDFAVVVPDPEVYDSFIQEIREGLRKELDDFIKEVLPSDPRWKRISQSNPDISLPGDYSEVEGFTLKQGNIGVWIYELTRIIGGEPVKRLEARARNFFGHIEAQVYQSEPWDIEQLSNAKRLKLEITESNPEFRAVAEVKRNLGEIIDGISDWRKESKKTPHWSLIRLINPGEIKSKQPDKVRNLTNSIREGVRLSSSDVNWLVKNLPENLLVSHQRLYGHFKYPVLGECTIRIEQLFSHDDRLLGANIKIRQRLGEDRGTLTQRIFARVTDPSRALQLYSLANCKFKGIQR